MNRNTYKYLKSGPEMILFLFETINASFKKNWNVSTGRKIAIPWLKHIQQVQYFSRGNDRTNSFPAYISTRLIARKGVFDTHEAKESNEKGCSDTECKSCEHIKKIGKK